jgi:hypothetical protein
MQYIAPVQINGGWHSKKESNCYKSEWKKSLRTRSVSITGLYSLSCNMTSFSGKVQQTLWRVRVIKGDDSSALAAFLVVRCKVAHWKSPRVICERTFAVSFHATPFNCTLFHHHSHIRQKLFDHVKALKFVRIQKKNRISYGIRFFFRNLQTCRENAN